MCPIHADRTIQSNQFRQNGWVDEWLYRWMTIFIAIQYTKLVEDSAHSSDVKTSSDEEIISHRSTVAHCCPISHQLILCVWKSAPPPQSSTLCRQFPTIQSPASLSPTEVSQIEQLTAAACFGKAAYLSS